MLTEPLYTQYVSDAEVVDGLGLGNLVESLNRTIFPGINNAVEFVRVYSAICWMVRRIETTVRETPNPDIAAISKAGLQKIQLLLTWHNRMKRVAGLAGATRRFPTDNSLVTLSFEKIASGDAADLLEKDPNAAVGNAGAHYLDTAQYGPSIVNGLKFLRANRAIRDTYELTESGKKLADAYEAAIAGSRRYEWLADISMVQTRRDDVAAMDEELDLRTPSAGERAAFARAYYPEEPEDVTGARVDYRCNGITLVLRALEAERESAAARGSAGVDTESLRYTMARGMTLAGVKMDLSGIGQVHGWWVNLQLHEYERLALDTLSRHVASWIQDAVLEENPRRDILDCSRGLGVRLERALPEEFRETVGSYVAYLEHRRGAAESFLAAGVTVPELRIESMLDALLDVCNFSERSTLESQALAEVYKALVYCAVEARQLLGNGYVEQKLPQDRLSLEALRGLLERFESHSPADFLAQVVQFHVVLLHFAVARDRTLGAKDGRNRFLFTVGDNGLERVTGKGIIGEVGLGQARFRLDHALLLLTQCEFVERFEDGTFALTEAGRQRLLRGTPEFGQAA